MAAEHVYRRQAHAQRSWTEVRRLWILCLNAYRVEWMQILQESYASWTTTYDVFVLSLQKRQHDNTTPKNPKSELRCKCEYTYLFTDTVQKKHFVYLNHMHYEQWEIPNAYCMQKYMGVSTQSIGKKPPQFNRFRSMVSIDGWCHFCHYTNIC